MNKENTVPPWIGFVDMKRAGDIIIADAKTGKSLIGIGQPPIHFADAKRGYYVIQKSGDNGEYIYEVVQKDIVIKICTYGEKGSLNEVETLWPKKDKFE